MTPTPTRLIIDGDSLAYRIALSYPPNEAILRARGFVEWLLSATYTSVAVMCLTGVGSNKRGRYEVPVVPRYQQSRTRVRPAEVEELHGWLAGYWELGPVHVSTDCEADDCIADLMRSNAEPAVVWSPDKDMRVLPGYHYDDKTTLCTYVAPETYVVEGYDGRTYGPRFFVEQMIGGDAADGIRGITYTSTKGKMLRFGPKRGYNIAAKTCTMKEGIALLKTLYLSAMGEGAPRAFANQAYMLLLTQRALDVPDLFREIAEEFPEGYLALKELSTQLSTIK